MNDLPPAVVTAILIITGIAFVIWLVSKEKRSASSPRQRSTTSTPTTAASQREQIVNCPNCGQRNRLVEVDGRSSYRCGSCHTELPNPFLSLGHAKPDAISTFRPSATKSSRAKNIAFKDAPADGQSFAPNDLVGVVDAFTGEALNAALGLYQCGKCQVYYHRASYEVIRSENGGQCVACLSTTIRTVSLAQPHRDSRPTPRKGMAAKPRRDSRAVTEAEMREASQPRREPSNYQPEVVTLFNYREHVGRVVSFQSSVAKVLASRRGRDFAVMFENLDWKDGFKMIVFRRHLAAVGGIPFVRGLQGRTIRVRGLVQKHPVFGYEIVVTESSMIQEIQ